jgi:hypothetical protein
MLHTDVCANEVEFDCFYWRTAMDIPQTVLEKLRILPPEKQQEVLNFAEFLNVKQVAVKRPRRDWIGTASDLAVELTEEDIAEARHEMWGSFPREDV